MISGIKKDAGIGLLVIYPTLYITAIEWEEVMNHNSLP